MNSKTNLFNKNKRYSLKKLSVGVVSCAVGWIIFMPSGEVHASDTANTNSVSVDKANEQPANTGNADNNVVNNSERSAAVRDASEQNTVYVRNGGYNSRSGQGTESVPYDSLKYALTKAKDGDIFKLTESVVFERGENVVINKNITLDGNNNNLTISGANLDIRGEVTLKNINIAMLREANNTPKIITNNNNVNFDNVTTLVNQNQKDEVPNLILGSDDASVEQKSSIGVVNIRNATENTKFKKIIIGNSNGTVKNSGAILSIGEHVQATEGISFSGGTNAAVNGDVSVITSSKFINTFNNAGNNSTLIVNNNTGIVNLSANNIGKLVIKSGASISPSVIMTNIKNLAIESGGALNAQFSTTTLNVGTIAGEGTINIPAINNILAVTGTITNTHINIKDPVMTTYAIVTYANASNATITANRNSYTTSGDYATQFPNTLFDISKTVNLELLVDEDHNLSTVEDENDAFDSAKDVPFLGTEAEAYKDEAIKSANKSKTVFLESTANNSNYISALEDNYPKISWWVANPGTLTIDGKKVDFVYEIDENDNQKISLPKPETNKYYVDNTGARVENLVLTGENRFKNYALTMREDVIATVEEKETLTTPFKVVEETDSSKYIDYTATRVEGVDGKEEITRTYKTVNGEKKELISVNKKTLVEVVNKVVVHGTKQVEGIEIGTEKVVTTEIVPFETIYEDDATRYTDDEREVTSGQNGEKKVTKTYRTEKGIRIGEPISTEEKVTKHPLTRIVKRGTRPIESISEVTYGVVFPGGMEYIYDDTMYEDEFIEIKESKTRLVTRHTIAKLHKNIVVEIIRVYDDIEFEGEPGLARIGTKPIEGTEEVVTTQDISFSTIYKDDNTIYKGEEIVETEGRVGTKKITTTYKTIRGVRTEEVGERKEEILYPVVNKVVKRGTKPVEGMETEVTTESVPFETIYEDDATMYTDEEREVTAGKAGEKTVTKTYRTEKGVRAGEPISTEEKVITSPQTRVVKRGTKPVEGMETEVTTESIPFETIYEDDATMYTDEEREVTAGKAGEKTVTKTYRTEKGVRTGEPISTEEKVTISPQTRVVKRGTKPIEGTIEVTEPGVIPHNIVYINDDTLEKGKSELVREGKDGVSEYHIVYRTIKGQMKEQLSMREDIVTPAIDKIVRVGTKEEKKPEPEEKFIDKKGEGQVNEKPELKITEEGLEYGTKEVLNPDLAKGERRIIQKGIKGKKEVATEITYKDGKEVSRKVIDEKIVPAVEEIVEVGTKEEKKPEPEEKFIDKKGEGQVNEKPELKITEEVLEYGTKEVLNPDLAKGERRIIQKGIKGKKEVVTEITYKDGKEVSRKVIDEKIVPAVEEIVEVGTKEEKKTIPQTLPNSKPKDKESNVRDNQKNKEDSKKLPNTGELPVSSTLSVIGLSAAALLLRRKNKQK